MPNQIASSPTVKAVLFDLDGTLLDTAPDFIMTLNQLCDEYQQPRIEPERIRQTVSDGARALTTLAFKINEGDKGFEERRQRLLDIYFYHMGKHFFLFGQRRCVAVCTSLPFIAKNIFFSVILCLQCFSIP